MRAPRCHRQNPFNKSLPLPHIQNQFKASVDLHLSDMHALDKIKTTVWC